MGDTTSNGNTAVEAAPLDAEQVLRDLTRAWQQRATVGGQDAVVRASTLNLLIYSPTDALSAAVEELLPRVIQSHPCRVIHIEAKPQMPDAGLRAWTQVHTSGKGDGVRQLIGEQITLDVHGGALNGLAGAILPLLDPDLPVYLWWRGDPPFEGPLFDSLVDVADYMVFDSGDFNEPDDDLSWLASLVKNHPFDIAFSDVSWARLSPWQALTAQFFDGVEQRLYLQGISEVRLEFARAGAPDGRGECEAWLTLGWLASRLGWSQASAPVAAADGTLTFALRTGRNGDTVAVTLHPVTESYPSYQGLAAIHLVANAPKKAHLRIEYLPDNCCARTMVCIEGAPALERVVKMEEADEALLIGREFQSPGRDRLYEDALYASVGMFAKEKAPA